MTTAAILSTGEEVLRGEIEDANATFIARTLEEHGFSVSLRLTVGDRLKDLQWAIGEALRHADLLVMTGGLGPTEDDLTAKAVADFAGVALQFNEAVWQDLKNRFAAFNIAVTDNNKRQAFFPASANMLPNPRGTALGFEVKVQDKDSVHQQINELTSQIQEVEVQLQEREKELSILQAQKDDVMQEVGKLTEENVTDALKEVRTALLSADVHFRVAREFVDRIKEKCLAAQRAGIKTAKWHCNDALADQQ